MSFISPEQDNWDLIITPRKKWYDLHLLLPSPGGGIKGEGVFLIPTCPNEVGVSHLPKSRGPL